MSSSKFSHCRNYLFLLFASSLVQDSLLYNILSLPQARLSEADYNSYDLRDHEGPGTYAFGYDVDDAPTGNTQFREEQRHPNGTVTGSYGYVEADGNIHKVFYVADELGYRVRIENSRDRLTPTEPPKAAFKPAYVAPVPVAYRPISAGLPDSGYFYNDRRFTAVALPSPGYSRTPVAIATGPAVAAPSNHLELPRRDHDDFPPDSKYYVRPLYSQGATLPPPVAVARPQYIRDRNGAYYYKRY